MTTLETKKLRVIERLAETNNEAIFDKIQELLDQDGIRYAIPKEHYDLLEEDRQKYLKGELETFTWEEVKKNARKAFDEMRDKTTK